MVDKTKKMNFFETFCGILIVLQCQSVFVNTSKIFSAPISILSIISILLLCLNEMTKGTLKTFIDDMINKTKIFQFLIYGMSVVFVFLIIEYLFIYRFKINPLLPFFISIFLLTIYFYYSRNMSFLRRIVSIITVLCLISILFLFLHTLGFSTNVSLINNWGAGNPYFNGYYYLDFISQTLPGTLIVRNSGIFAEPSIYGFVIVSGILIQVFILQVKNKKELRKLIVMFITVITTTSSTAIVISLFILVIIAFKYFLLNKSRIILYVYGTVVSITGILIAVVLYISKKSQGYNIYSSYAIRSNDVYACLHAWFKNILFGVGIGNNNDIGKFMFSYRQSTGFGLSMGMMSILAYGGIIMFIIYLTPSFLMLFQKKSILIVAILINIYLFYAMVQETYLYGVFMSYFWAKVLSEKWGVKDFELFSSRIRTVWSNIRSRSSKKG